MSTSRIGSFLVLSEDGAQNAHETTVAVVRRMLQLIVPECQTHRIGFEPKDEQAQRAVQGTGWKQKRPSPEFITALRTIATKLGRADGFVFFHFDGDRTWSTRHTSENASKWKSQVIDRVRQLLLTRPSTTPEEIESMLARLLPIVPFYSIEAWLYQNTDVAIRICREKYQGRDIGKFERWKHDRTLLDDVHQPKEQTCLKGAHNVECARQGFPAEEVRTAARSYAETVQLLQECEALKAVLRSTNEWIVTGE